MYTFSKTKTTELDQTFRHFALNHLTQLEKEFIGEYVRIMGPLTEAVDVLQNEENMNIGGVIPTIKLLMVKMEELLTDPTIIHCRPLVSAVLGGLHIRFDDALKADYTSLLKGAVRRFKDSSRSKSNILLQTVRLNTPCNVRLLTPSMYVCPRRACVAIAE